MDSTQDAALTAHVKKRFPQASHIRVTKSGRDWLVTLVVDGSQYVTFIDGLSGDIQKECENACNSIKAQIHNRTSG